MSAHYHYVTLPGRQVGEQSDDDRYYNGGWNIVHDPELFQIEVIGGIHLGFVSHSEYLYVFKDKISGQVFFVEIDSSEQIDGLVLFPHECEYSGWSPEYKRIPAYGVIYPDKREQFKHYVMGWKPSVWDYDRSEREELCAAIDRAFAT